MDIENGYRILIWTSLGTCHRKARVRQEVTTKRCIFEKEVAWMEGRNGRFWLQQGSSLLFRDNACLFNSLHILKSE
jgi:hypothetical protein